MTRLSNLMLCVWLCAVPVSLSGTAQAEIPSNLECSAHFQARSIWLRGMGGHPVAVTRYGRYAEDLLLDHAADTDYGGDWDLILGHKGWDQHLSETAKNRDHRAEDLLVTWANRQSAPNWLPLCMEDESCQKCISGIKSRKDE